MSFAKTGKVGSVGKDWRPEDWERMRVELASLPMIWSASGPNLSHAEQIVEATASRILEAYINAGKAN